MKKIILFIFLAFFSFISCQRPLDCCSPIPSYETACIQSKINAMAAANKSFTSVKRYKKNDAHYWLFDTGSAFDAPQYMLNATCDTVCTWCFCPSRPPCQLEYNLNDSTAVIIWKK